MPVDDGCVFIPSEMSASCGLGVLVGLFIVVVLELPVHGPAHLFPLLFKVKAVPDAQRAQDGVLRVKFPENLEVVGRFLG